MDGRVVLLGRPRIEAGNRPVQLPGRKPWGLLDYLCLPDMGWHYRNPSIQGFDITKPPILVYERHGRSWQLGALEWVFTEQPASPPLPGASYGAFPAACHYRDGTFVAARVPELCPTRSPTTGARFSFWHPDLVTLHLWVWYPNPAGLYHDTNPWIQPFNHT